MCDNKRPSAQSCSDEFVRAEKKSSSSTPVLLVKTPTLTHGQGVCCAKPLALRQPITKHEALATSRGGEGGGATKIFLCIILM